MAVPVKPKRDEAWLSRAQIAGVFDVSVQYFDRVIRPLVASNHIRRRNGRVWFYGRGVVEAWARAQAPQPSTVEPSIDDLLLTHQLENWEP